MKKQLLSTALSSLLCISVHADNTQHPDITNNTIAAPIQEAAAEPAAMTAGSAVPATKATSSVPSAPLPLPVVDCDYPIPATTTTIDESIISTWAAKAAVQTFDFNPVNVDSQLDKLKTCFTDQGWQGFHDALDKSGNINSIKTQNLTVSSKVDGEVSVNPVKENQWKVTLPMHVVYKNDKENLTQKLSVDLLIGRKISGNLGIMQVIATPRDTASTATDTTTTATPAATTATPAASPDVTTTPDVATTPDVTTPDAATPNAATPDVPAPDAAAPDATTPGTTN